eukprot:UN20766
MTSNLDMYIKEIDFCVQSLNLSMTLIQTSLAAQKSFPERDISPACFLRASNRIRNMHSTGGDVCICFGTLFEQRLNEEHLNDNHTNKSRNKQTKQKTQ